MKRRLPTVLLVMGILGMLLGFAYLIWLVASQQQTLLDLFNAGLGDPQAIHTLRGHNLGSPLAVYTTVVTFFLELVLTFILIRTALGLLTLRPWARWAAVFYGIFMIAVGLSNVGISFYLASPNMPDLLAVIARGVIVLYAIVLWGVMFLPSVTAVYAGGAPPANLEEEIFEEEEPEVEPEPAPRRRRVKAGSEEEEP
jgi:hypothetical protein